MYNIHVRPYGSYLLISCLHKGAFVNPCQSGKGTLGRLRRILFVHFFHFEIVFFLYFAIPQRLGYKIKQFCRIFEIFNIIKN